MRSRLRGWAGARRLLSIHGSELAAIVLDPMPSRGGLTKPTPEFISAVQETARSNYILVIADEVLNLRQGFEGASARYGLVPDLIALGKIIGGGLPIGAIGERSHMMSVFDASTGRPLLPQGGTFSANPLSMVAGLAAMTALDHAAFAHLEQLGNAVRDGLEQCIAKRSAPMSVSGAASLFRIHPTRRVPNDYREAYPSPQGATLMRALTRFFSENGVILPNGASACLSMPMGRSDAEFIVDVFGGFLDAHAGLLDEIEGGK
jgi:glutamate-1-semialdehyde 2,1-aminomutase